jgi:hypothetical protein
MYWGIACNYNKNKDNSLGRYCAEVCGTITIEAGSEEEVGKHPYGK